MVCWTVQNRQPMAGHGSAPSSTSERSHACLAFAAASCLTVAVRSMAHYSFIDSLMYGELYNYTKGPVYYLLELSGLPFGMMNDLYGWGAPNLGGEPNIHYGALCKPQRDVLPLAPAANDEAAVRRRERPPSQRPWRPGHHQHLAVLGRELCTSLLCPVTSL